MNPQESELFRRRSIYQFQFKIYLSPAPLTLRHYSVWLTILLQVISMSDHESYRMATHPLPLRKLPHLKILREGDKEKSQGIGFNRCYDM